MRDTGGLTSVVMSEIRQQLAPFHGGNVTGSTVISDGATIDSLTVMDMIMALEDRFEIYLPLNRVADIHTVDQLAQAVLDLCARR